MAASALKVLIVDDEPSVRHALGVLFDLHGLAHVSAGSPQEALDAVESGEIGVVLQDMNFGPDKTSGEQGIRLFHRIRAADPHVPVLLIHGADDVETPPDHSRRIYDAVKGPKRLRLVPGVGHNHSLQPDVWPEIDAWIDQALHGRS